jgi:type VII secretion-associated serine protease mycosin
MHVVRRPAAALCAAALGALAVVMLPAVPASADDVRDRQWYLSALDLPEMHKTTQGEGVTVAVVDTGVDATHPDLRGNVLPGLDLYDDKAKGRVDRATHGTAMASIIAGHGHGTNNADGVLGIAPKAKILPVTIKNKKQGIISPQALAVGIKWAVDHGADVVNVSLSSSSNDDLDRAVKYAYENNVIVVASVGNRQDALIGWPARHPGALAVTGTNRKGGLGPESIPAEQTDIAAPSVDIVDAVPGGTYSTSTSTSSATAVVSGAVALVRAKYPTLNSYHIFERILETTRDAGEPGKDQDYGWGVLDLRDALTGQPDGRNKKAEPEPSEPVYPWHQKTDGGSIWEILIPAIGIPVIILILFSPLLIWRRRRKRRRAAEAAAANAPSGGGSSPDGAAALHPAGVHPAANQPTATQPTGAGSTGAHPAAAPPTAGQPSAAQPTAGQPTTPVAAADDDAVWRPPAQ